MFTRLLAVLTAGLFALPLWADTEFDGLVKQAISRSPAINAAKSALTSAIATVSSAGLQPDPRLMIEYENDGLNLYSFGSKPGSQWMISYTQELMTANKPELNSQMQGFRAGMAAIAVAQAQTDVVNQIRTIWTERAAVTQQIALLQSEEAIYQTLEAAAIDRYRAGIESQDNVLMAQADRFMSKEKTLMLQSKAAQLDAQLRQVCSLSASEKFPTPDHFLKPVWTPGTDQLDKMVSANALMIREKELARLMAITEARMSELELTPDIMVSGTYSQKAMDMENMWKLGLSIPLQFTQETRQKAAITAAEAALKSRTLDLENTVRISQTQARNMVTMLKSTESVLQIYESGLLPNAKSAIDSAVSQYRNGKSELTMVLQKIKTFIQTERTWIELQSTRDATVFGLYSMVKPEGVITTNK